MQYGFSAVVRVVWDTVSVAPALLVAAVVALADAGAIAPAFAVSVAVADLVASIP